MQNRSLYLFTFAGMIKAFFFAVILCCLCVFAGNTQPPKTEEQLVLDLFRLRNEHKADSAELFYADTVKVYMKYLRNIPRSTITRSDKAFWKAHPKNKFEITAPLKKKAEGVNTVITIYGKEFLDGTSFMYERIEIKFNQRKKIFSYRGYNWNGK